MSTDTQLCAGKRHYPNPQQAYAAIARVMRLVNKRRPDIAAYRCPCGQGFCTGRAR